MVIMCPRDVATLIMVTGTARTAMVSCCRHVTFHLLTVSKIPSSYYCQLVRTTCTDLSLLDLGILQRL